MRKFPFHQLSLHRLVRFLRVIKLIRRLLINSVYAPLNQQHSWAKWANSATFNYLFYILYVIAVLVNFLGCLWCAAFSLLEGGGRAA